MNIDILKRKVFKFKEYLRQRQQSFKEWVDPLNATFILIYLIVVVIMVMFWVDL